MTPSDSTDRLGVRRYRPGDRNAVWTVHERAFRASLEAFDPELDRHLRAIEEQFLAPGGDFLVALVDPAAVDGPSAETLPETTRPAAGGDADGGGGGGSGKDGKDADGDDGDGKGDRVVAVGGLVPATAPASSLDSSAPVAVDPEVGELRSLRVDPAARRRGYGRRIVRALEERARRAGLDRVVAVTVDALRAARSLYDDLGYREVGRHEVNGEERIYLRRSL